MSDAPNSNGKMRWYVIQAFSGYEQRVAESLKQQIELQNMQDYFGEVLVPKEKVKEIRDGKKYESERKFFPGYVFIHMLINEQSWLLVRHTDRVVVFVVGEVVRACDGAFKDFSGTVEAVDYEKNRITVSIAIFGRATPVELEFNQVEKEK